MNKTGADHQKLSGFIFAGAAFVSWGVLPAFWKLLDAMDPFEILCNRIVWSFLIVAAMAKLTGRYKAVCDLLKDRKKLIAVMLASFFVTVNWLVYIIAVNSGRIVEASLGYYINPLLSFFLGTAVLREKAGKLKIIAVFFAGAGVVFYAAGMGSVPWISLILAFSFGTYGLIKKITGAGALESLALETAFMVPPAVAYMILCAFRCAPVWTDPGTWLLLPASGAVTALPLFFFALAAGRIQLSSVGFMQFLAPSINLVMGVFIYNESFTERHLTSFAFIWAGLILYLSSQLFSVKRK